MKTYNAWALSLSNYGSTCSYLAKDHLFNSRLRGSVKNKTRLYPTRKAARMGEKKLKKLFSAKKGYEDIIVDIVKVRTSIEVVSDMAEKERVG